MIRKTGGNSFAVVLPGNGGVVEIFCDKIEVEPCEMKGVCLEALAAPPPYFQSAEGCIKKMGMFCCKAKGFVGCHLSIQMSNVNNTAASNNSPQHRRSIRLNMCPRV